MKLAPRYQILFLVFLVLALYYPALFAEVSTVDDERMLTYLLNLESFSLKELFFPGTAFYYRPLLMLTFMVDKYVWGLHETFMHLENMLLHLVNTLLVFGSAWSIRKKWYADSPGELPLVAAVFFAVHPIATESVNWISGRTDLLSGTFLFLALYLLLCGALRDSRLVTIASSLSFLFACMSKDSAIAAFPAFLILTWTATGASPRASLQLRRVGYLSFTGSALCYFLLRHFGTSGRDTGIGGVAGAVAAGDRDLLNKARIVLKVFGFYAKKLFAPWPLNFAIVNVSDGYALLGAVVVVACLVGFWLRKDILSSLFLLAASTVVPALLVPLGSLTWTPVAERYVYMSTAPFCLALTFIGYGYWQRCERSRLILCSSLVLVALFTYSTAQRTLVWQKNLTLFQDAVAKTPDFAPLKNELAVALERTGNREAALRLYQSNVMPNSAKYSIVTDLNRARACLSQGKPAEARELLLAKNYDRSKPLYTSYLEMLIASDEKMLLQPDFPQRAGLEREVRDCLLILAEVTGDPVQYYRIAKKFFGLGMKQEACKYFTLAYQNSSQGAFYKQAAKRMADKCRENSI